MRFVWVGIGLLGLAIVLPAGRPMKREKTPAGQSVPVLVELFTSEGCSSCPPADRLLAKLQSRQPVAGANIVPLSEHVDYWNTAAWTDPFSAPTYTQRQAQYVKSLRSDGAYTPQMVVDGRAEFVGSDEDAARNAISAALQKQKATVAVRANLKNSDIATVHVETGALPEAYAQDTAEAFVAVTENNLANHVRGGENRGRELTHMAVVRSLRSIGFVRPGAPFIGGVDVKLNPGSNKRDVDIVVFLQAHRTGAILGVAMCPLPTS